MMLRLAIRPCVSLFAAALCVLATALPAAAQSVSVTSAEPNFGEQDTLSLNVWVKGKNFAPGARAEFLLDDDSTGGITVNGTTFVSSTEVIANVTIASGASLTLFDIRVRNANGRTGRGSDLFQVVEKGARAACATEPLDPARFDLVSTLNYLTGPGATAYGPFLGVSVSLAPTTLTLPDASVRQVLVAAVGTSRATARMEFFLLNPADGALLDGPPLCATCANQGHASVAIPSGVPGEAAGSRHISRGDVNADGIPDFAVADQVTGSVAVFVGEITTDGRLAYSAIALPRPLNSANYGFDVAIGDLDGVAGDEIAVGKPASGSAKNQVPAAVYLYRISGATPTLFQTFVPSVSPALKIDDWYASDLAIGDVTNDGKPDLVVGVPYREVAGVTDAGAIFVHLGTGPLPYSLTQTPLLLSAAIKVSKEYFGYRVGIGNADSMGTLDVVTLMGGNTNPHGELLHGPVVNGQLTNPTYALLPRSGLASGWGQNQPEIGDLNGDGWQDVVIAAPGVSTGGGGCIPQGMAYVYLGGPSGWTRLTIQAPYDSDGSTFGYGLGIVDGYPFIVVGNNQFNLGSESNPGGQAFVYRVK